MPQLGAWLRLNMGATLAASAGSLWCTSYAWPIVDPAAMSVVLKGDWAQHTLGWLFFRREAWALPLGSLPSYLHPVGTNLGYTDSIPWVALALRPLSALLPLDFQYLGLFIVLCSAALAFVAAKVFAWSTPHWEQQAAAGTLTAAAPTLIERLIHPALCAHALLVGAIALYFVAAQSRPRACRLMLGAFALLALSTATHPYLASMTLVLLVGLPWQHRHQLGPRTTALVMVGLPLWMTGELALLGYLEPAVATTAHGFGAYSVNLNTFVNSMGLSRLSGTLPQGPKQYEGYCYLGAGSLVLWTAALTLCALPRLRARAIPPSTWRAAWPLAASVAMALFALASPVTWGDRALLHVPLYEHLPWLTQTFRASGRFIWPLYYLLSLAAVVAVLRTLRGARLLGSGLLLSALALQLYDIDTSRVPWLFTPTRVHARLEAQWALAEGAYRHLVVYPAEIQDVCAGPLGYRDELMAQLGYLAYRHGWSFNSGYVARPRRGTRAYCEALQAQVARGDLDDQSIYVVGRWDVRKLREAGASCGLLDGLIVCVKRSAEPFARSLASH